MENKIKKISLKMNLIWNSTGSTMYFFAQWLFTIIVVRIMGYENAGILSLAMTITNLFTQIAHYNMRNFQASDTNSTFNNGTYIATRIITSTAALILCLIFTITNNYTIIKILCINLYMIFRIGECFVDVFHAIDQKNFRLDIIGKSFFIRSGLYFFGAFISILIFHNMAIALLCILVVTIGEIILYDIPSTAKLENIRLLWDKNEIKNLLIISLPLMISGIIATIIAFYPRYLLEKLIGSESLGIYTTVASPTLVVQILASFIFSPLVPIFAKYYNESKKEKLKELFNKIIKIMIIMSIITILSTVLFGTFVLRVIFQEGILQYSYLLLPSVISTILTAFVWYFFTILTSIRKIKELLISSIISMIICLIITPYLIMHYEMNGVNYSFIIVQTIQIMIMIIYYKKFAKICKK